MKNQYQKRVLILALFAGEIMMKSGAEIYRVEDTIVRICRACRIDYVECFATTTGIFLSLDSGKDDNDMHTFIKRIERYSIDLSRISRINQFSRVFTTTDLSVGDGFEQLRAINVLKVFPLPLRVLAAMLIGAFITPYYGGSPLDLVCAAAVAGIGHLISSAIGRLGFPAFIRIFVSCAGGALIALSLSAIITAINVSPVLIGATAIFLPGVSITNAARDLLSGDMLSGVARFAEAVIAAVAIAGGIGAVVKIWMLAGGDYSWEPGIGYATPWYLLFGFFCTVGFCILFNAPWKLIPIASMIGSVGMFTLVTCVSSDYSVIAASFIGSCIVAILAEFASRAGKDATTVFILPGIIPFVPGVTIYRTMGDILSSDFAAAASNGTETLITAGSIAVALILVATITRLLQILIQRVSRWFSSSRENEN
jgi:uncharacterized membrane protein YjjP (DUF1212 family)